MLEKNKEAAEELAKEYWKTVETVGPLLLDISNMANSLVDAASAAGIDIASLQTQMDATQQAFDSFAGKVNVVFPK